MMNRPWRSLLSVILLLLMAGLACNFGQNPPEATNTPLPEVATPTANVQAPPVEEPETVEPEVGQPDEPEPVAELITYENEALGLRLDYPETWVIDDSDGFVTLASDEVLLTSDEFDQDAAGMFIAAGPGSQFEGDSVEDALVAAMEQLSFSDTSTIVEGPESTTINGQEAAVATIEGVDNSIGNRLIFHVTLIRGAGRSALAAGISLPDAFEQFRPTFETISSSIRLSAPPVPEAQGTIDYGEIVSGTVPEGGSSAWSFVGEAGDTVEIMVEPTEPLDVTVDVLDSSGTSILPDGLVDEAFGTEEIQGLPLPGAGEYLIVLSGFAASGGTYELALSQAATAGQTGLSLGETVTGTIAENEAADYLFVSPTETQITIMVEPEEELDVVIEVLNPTNGEVLAEEDASFGTEIINFTPAAGAEYLIRVRGFAGGSGSYTLAVTETAFFTANTIIAADTLEEDDPGHVYPFAAAAGEPVVAQVVPDGDLDVVVEIWDDDNTTLLDTVDLDRGTEQVNFTTPETGNYYLNILGFEGQPGTYTLTLGGTDQVIFEITYDDIVQGTVSEEGFLDYSIRLDPGQTVVLDVEGIGQMDAVVQLLNLDEAELASEDVGGAGETETLAYTAPADIAESTVYLIRISEYSGNAGSFTMTVRSP